MRCGITEGVVCDLETGVNWWLEKSDQCGWLSGSRRLDCDEITQVTWSRRLEKLIRDVFSAFLYLQPETTEGSAYILYGVTGIKIGPCSLFRLLVCMVIINFEYCRITLTARRGVLRCAICRMTLQLGMTHAQLLFRNKSCATKSGVSSAHANCNCPAWRLCDGQLYLARAKDLGYFYRNCVSGVGWWHTRIKSSVSTEHLVSAVIYEGIV